MKENVQKKAFKERRTQQKMNKKNTKSANFHLIKMSTFARSVNFKILNY